ncbi:MAG: hypothetical protein V4592_18370 [Bacteroidota bacterium]
MLRSVIIIVLSAFSLQGLGQVKDIIDKNIALIKYVPYGKSAYQDSRKLKRANKLYRLHNPQYREILSLDTLAIPYLIEKISDTIETGIHVPCITRTLTRGDVSFVLLNDIIFIPWSAVTHSQWDSLSCGPLPDGAWEYLDHQRNRFQKELRDYFLSEHGKIWMKIFKADLSKEERAKLWKGLPPRQNAN